MAQPRPVFRCAFTVPPGGWVLTVQIKTSQAGAYDTARTVTVPAGTYYMAGDNQNADFLLVLMDLLYTNFEASGIAAYATGTKVGKVFAWIDQDSHKVGLLVNGGADVNFRWTQTDGDDIAAVLGFDASADDSFTSAALTADYHHAYAWYADEDGNLASSIVEDVTRANALQTVAPDGEVQTHFIGETSVNLIELMYLTRGKTYSRGVSYGTSPVDPYARNVGFECMWREIRRGVPFRFYRNGYVSTSRAEATGTLSAGTTTTATDAGKAFTTEPQQHKGKILSIATIASGSATPLLSWYITSHTATVFTVPNDVNNSDLDIGGTTPRYYVFDHRYQTYVLDLERMKEFAPRERPAIDRYDVSVPVLVYVE